jgi:iron complex outermembrane receptor protein
VFLIPQRGPSHRSRFDELPVGVKLVASYTYTDAEVTRDNNAAIVGLPVNLTPKHTFALWANQQRCI